MTPAEWRRAVQDCKQLQQSIDKLEGQLTTYLQQLQDEFGCESLEAANELLVELEDKLQRLQSTYRRKADDFYATWESHLDATND